jgi:tRNA(Ile)-lysidine synthase
MGRRAMGPALLSVVQAIEARLPADEQALCVACSGGPDSLALAAATVRIRRPDLSLAAVVVDHGLQDGSAGVAARTRDQLVELGYHDVTVVPVEVDRAGQGLEAAARAARYQVLNDEAARRDATVLLGHTRDDQAETVLLGLARGSGLRSLAGMAPRTGRYLRPLLSLTRATTVAVCAELGLDPWHDPDNADPAYSRSRVRSRVLPLLEAELGPGIADALARTAVLARDDADLLDELAAEAHPAAERLDCSRLNEIPAALRRRVIRSWLVSQGASDVSYGHVVAVEALVTGWHGQKAIDVSGLRVVRVGGRLRRERQIVAG